MPYCILEVVDERKSLPTLVTLVVYKSETHTEVLLSVCVWVYTCVYTHVYVQVLHVCVYVYTRKHT